MYLSGRTNNRSLLGMEAMRFPQGISQQRTITALLSAARCSRKILKFSETTYYVSLDRQNKLSWTLTLSIETSASPALSSKMHFVDGGRFAVFQRRTNSSKISISILMASSLWTSSALLLEVHLHAVHLPRHLHVVPHGCAEMAEHRPNICMWCPTVAQRWRSCTQCEAYSTAHWSP